jgi:hypothetical protein
MPENELQEIGGAHGPSGSSMLSVSSRVSKVRRRLAPFKAALISLGWRKGFVEKAFAGDDGRFLGSEGTVYWIEQYATSWFDATGAGAGSNLAARLYSVGLSRRASTTIASKVAPLEDSCYSIDQLFDVVLGVVLGRYAPMTSPNARFLVAAPTDEWTFDKALDRHAYNFSAPLWAGRMRSVMKARLREHGSSTKLLFHATNWKHGVDVLRRGPSHVRGRVCLDFGISPSFYASDDVDAVLDWCVKNGRVWNREACVLIFAVDLPTSGLDVKAFASADDRWRELTTHSRRCEDNRNALDAFDVVCGPMVANVRGILERDQLAVAHARVKNQCAFKSDRADLYLKERLIGVVWIDKRGFL